MRRRGFVLVASALCALPIAAHAEPSVTLEVHLFADGHAEVGGRRVDDAGLEAAARAHVSAVGGTRARATIAADQAVVYSRVIAVMDALRRGGIDQVSMLVAPAACRVSTEGS
jgi:biopolymer transport protein ExbD